MTTYKFNQHNEFFGMGQQTVVSIVRDFFKQLNSESSQFEATKEDDGLVYHAITLPKNSVSLPDDYTLDELVAQLNEAYENKMGRFLKGLRILVGGEFSKEDDIGFTISEDSIRFTYPREEVSARNSWQDFTAFLSGYMTEYFESAQEKIR